MIIKRIKGVYYAINTLKRCKALNHRHISFEIPAAKVKFFNMLSRKVLS